MKFEFNALKDRLNLAKHGIGLAFAELLFVDGAHIVEDSRCDYGEERLIASGLIEGRLFVCVFVKRYDVVRVISLRKGNARERAAFDKH